MITQNRGTIAFAVCGSFCTLEAALQSARALTAQGWQLLPVMSFAARQDTRFGTGNYWKEQLEAAASRESVAPVQGATTSACAILRGPSGSTACKVSSTGCPAAASSCSFQ